MQLKSRWYCLPRYATGSFLELEEEDEPECIYEPRIVAKTPSAAKDILRAIARETLEEGLSFSVSVREYEYICVNGEISKVEQHEPS